MEIKNIIEYIDAPYKLQDKDFIDLQSLVEKYPYFNTANLLFVKAAHNLNKEDYSVLIAKVSASVPNRELLFNLINLSAPVKKEKVIKEKKDESDTRKEIRERIQNRRQKRMIIKGDSLFNHGSSIHEKIVLNFFEPIIKKLAANEMDIGLMPEQITEFYPQDETVKKTADDKKNAQREKKRIEREKRMEEKLKLRIAEKEKMSEGDFEKEKEEREKRRLEREKRMEERRKRRETEIKDTKEPSKNIIKETIKVKKEKRFSDREKRMEDKLKRREKEKFFKEKTESENREITESKVEEIIQTETVIDTKSETGNINIEKDPYTNIIKIGSDEKINEKKSEVKAEIGKEIIKESEKETDSDDLVIIIEEDIPEVFPDKISEKKVEDKKQTDEKTDSENKEDEKNKSETKKDDSIVIKKDKSLHRKKRSEIIVEELYNKPTTDKSKNDLVEIDDIYDKIISSKKPITKSAYNFIEINEDITGLDDEQKDVLEESEKNTNDEVINDTFKKDVEAGSEEFELSEDIEFEIEDKTKNIEDTVKDSKKTKIESTDFKDEVFELINEETNFKKSKEKDEVKAKESVDIIEEENKDELKEFVDIKENEEEKDEVKAKESIDIIEDENKDELKEFVDIKENEEEKHEVKAKESVDIIEKENKDELKEFVDIKENEEEKDEVKTASVNVTEEEKATDKNNKTKAAESVFARIEAFKKKRAKSELNSKVNSKKTENNENDLIEKFVKEEPSINRSSPKDIIDETIDIKEKKSSEKKPVITELMASIYVNQDKFNEAIEIYEKLILKNPEKRDYFAAKIKKLKN